MVYYLPWTINIITDEFRTVFQEWFIIIASFEFLLAGLYVAAFEDYIAAFEDYIAPFEDYIAPFEDYTASFEDYTASFEDYTAPFEDYTAPFDYQITLTAENYIN